MQHHALIMPAIKLKRVINLELEIHVAHSQGTTTILHVSKEIYRHTIMYFNFGRSVIKL